MQSITTKYLAPTNRRGGRIKARTTSGHYATVAYDHALSVFDNHASVARRVAVSLRWSGRWVGGPTKDGYVFINANGDGFDLEAAV